MKLQKENKKKFRSLIRSENAVIDALKEDKNNGKDDK